MDSERTAPGTDASAEGIRELTRLVDELLPALVARLSVSRMGELEVRQGDRLVRLRREPLGRPVAGPAARHGDPAHPGAAAGRPDGAQDIATSPAVGYFAPRPRLAVGQAVQEGDVLGWVEVLGVRQEVVAAVTGVVGRVLVEAGQAVEYGQELILLDAAPPTDAEVSGTDSVTAQAASAPESGPAGASGSVAMSGSIPASVAAPVPAPGAPVGGPS